MFHTAIPEANFLEARNLLREAQARLITAEQALVNFGLPVRAEHLKGLSVAEVARRFEVAPDAVLRNLDRYALARRDRHAPLDRETIRRLYVTERLGVRAVAERLGVSADKVRADLARYRIPIRPPGRPARTAG